MELSFPVWAIATATITAGSLYYHYKYHYKKTLAEENRRLQKKLKLDYLKINKLLTFGISRSPCEGHKFREFDCGNLDCNYGRLGFIINIIKNAKRSIDLCIYIITAPIFGDVIINAHKMGIRVRVIADFDMSFSAQSVVNTFRQMEIPVRQRPSPYIMHHKFFIIDDEILINGSMNLTMTGVFCNWENVIITTQPPIVDQFYITFNALWEEFSPLNKIPSPVRSGLTTRKKRKVPKPIKMNLT